MRACSARLQICLAWVESSTSPRTRARERTSDWRRGELRRVRAAGPETARLLATCADRPGIVAAISNFLYERGANIITSDQYSSDPEGGSFFVRMSFRLPGIETRKEAFEADFASEVAERFEMRWRFSYGQIGGVAVMRPRYDHCLLDVLWRTRRGELPMELTMVDRQTIQISRRRSELRRALSPRPCRPGRVRRALRRRR